MRRSAAGPVTDSPAAGRWDFGGFPYGLEPLVLPAPGEPDALHGPPGDPAGWQLVRAAAAEPVPTSEEGESSGGEDPLAAVFWFRWIVGHQVSFAVWRLIGQLLDDVKRGRADPAAACAPLAAHVRTYSAMLLYSGSCPRGVYDVLVRPTMRRWHRGFSGSWAPDYPAVRDLLRGRPTMLDDCSGAAAADLLAAVRLHGLVHAGIAASLVPDGRSLLNRAALPGLHHDTTALLYDSFFVTSRAPVGRRDVVSQLLRRLVAIAHDLATHGLHPVAGGTPPPPELQTPEVIACGDGLIEVLLATAQAAAAPARPGPANTTCIATQRR